MNEKEEFKNDSSPQGLDIQSVNQSESTSNEDNVGEYYTGLSRTQKYKTRKKNSSETWEWIKALGIAVLIAFFIRAFIFAPIVVDGESMLPTLHDRERLIVNKAVYLYSEPKRGDIVVFHATENKDWIKRVIGEPGDVVKVEDGVLYVNNNVVEEPYLKAGETGIVTNDFVEIVPDHYFFLMGDNRPNSRDSRIIGSVPSTAVVGRADFVFWPVSSFRFVQSEN